MIEFLLFMIVLVIWGHGYEQKLRERNRYCSRCGKRHSCYKPVRSYCPDCAAYVMQHGVTR
jgi:uncharacterized OB-fold protein